MSERIFVDEINIGKRFRQEMGDLDALATSIKKKHGLLHPIVVARQGKLYHLIAGLRRLRAIKDILHWSKIEATIVDLAQGIEMIEAEHDENEIRKQPTPSERVEIGKEIERLIGNRQGKKAENGSLPQKIGEVEKGKETTEIAAEKAGFGNPETYRQAKSVVANGTPQLVEAMDAGDVSISDAAKVSSEPPKEQKAAVKAVKAGQAPTAAAAVQHRKKKQGAPIFDDRPAEKMIGQLIRFFDARATIHGKGPKHAACVAAMEKVLSAWKQWQVETNR